jgi:hypothetical protein
MARTNLSVDQAVFEEFSAQAERQNKTLFAFANESLSAIARIAAEGGNPADLYSLWSSVSLLKQIDVITLPSDFVDVLIARMYKTDKASLLKTFGDLGSSLVGLLKIAAKDLNELSKLAKDFTILLPVKQFKILSDVNNDIEVDIVGAGRIIESTECTFEFLQAILNGYSYSVSKRDIGVGTLRIWAHKRGVP